MNGWTTRHKTLTGTTAAVVLATVTAWLLWPSPAKPAPRERQYQTTTACLLTDDKGIATDPAKTVWAGIQDASLTTHIKVQYLAVYGPQTTANAMSYFNSLGAQKCTMILAVGPAPVDAMTDGHTQFPNTKHVAVGGAVQATPIMAVPTDRPEALRKTVADIVTTIG